jgi:hypothetical protein
MSAPIATSDDGIVKRAPIFMAAEPVPGGIRIQVIGASDVEYEAAFTLETECGGNRTVHRGVASLSGSASVVLSTVNLGTTADRPWNALLRVDPQSGASYELVASNR